MGKEIFEPKSITGKEELINQVHTKAGELWDLFHSEGCHEQNSSSGRLYALAKTNLEQAVMWFVKGVSRSN